MRRKQFVTAISLTHCLHFLPHLTTLLLTLAHAGDTTENGNKKIRRESVLTRGESCSGYVIFRGPGRAAGVVSVVSCASEVTQ